MRLNYRWDLTGFEEEEVSGRHLPRALPCPPSHDLPGPPTSREEARSPGTQAGLLPRFTALAGDSRSVARVTV